MVKGCCVPFCNTQRGEKISLHEIPSDLKMRAEWLQVLPLKDFIPLDHSKVCANHFQKSDFSISCRSKRLKKDAIPSIFEGCPTIITDKEKNYVVKQSTKYSSDVELVQTSESEASQTRSNLSSVLSKLVTQITSSSTNSVGSQLNLPSIVAKQSITPSVLMKKNAEKSIYVLDKNKTTTPMKEATQTVTNKCTSSNIENNYTGLQKRKADVNNCVVNKMLKTYSTPKNKAVSFSMQSTCSSNETLSVPNTEKGTTSASQLSHQLVSQDLPSDDEAVTASDMNYEGVGGENKSAESETGLNLRNVPSNRFTGIKNNRSNQAGTLINRSRVTSSAASKELSKQTGLPAKYFDANSYKVISELRHKNKNMISLLCKKNKKIRLLQAKLEEMSEKLEYFENHEVMRKVEKLLVVNDKGLASNQIKFLLCQLSNLDKKSPRWPDDIVRECVLLHASNPKCYAALQKSELIKLPCKNTLCSFLAKKSQPKNVSDLEPEPELATEIVNYEPDFENEAGGKDNSGETEEDISQYFNTIIGDMF